MTNPVRHPYFYPAITGVLFALAMVAGVLAVPEPNEQPIPGMSTAAKSLLALAFLFLAAWFLHAFTQADRGGPEKRCEAEQTASIFRFAYTFAVFSFALLVLPFTAMLRSHETPPDAGPIRLIRACVQPQPAARAASASASQGPVDLCPEAALPGNVIYPWLVAVGGVVAQECGPGHPCAKAAEPPHPPASAGNRALAPLPMYEVRGGFVVPFYVVVFAFVGGIVNLTRRVPEYQKRASCNFAGTATESCVTLLEAREFVVFQLMQLMSSPFLAMVAYYALEPKSVASAVVLAFASGFATESVLLLIRGMFAGLQPTTTKTAAVGGAATTAQLHVVLRRAGGLSVDKAKVELRRLPLASPPLKAEVVDATGEIEFKTLPPGTLWVVATLDLPGAVPNAIGATQKVQLAAGQTESIDLTLT